VSAKNESVFCALAWVGFFTNLFLGGLLKSSKLSTKSSFKAQMFKVALSP